MVTDYIVATTLVFFDLDNIDALRICFGQPSYLEASDFRESDHVDHNSIMEVFDLEEWRWDHNLCQPRGLPKTQELGSVVARKGRMVSFPGPVCYRFEPCKLLDPSKPGTARYLALYLVEPNYRVCSTRNVPPQRRDWWAYDVAMKAPQGLGDLPPELFDEIFKNVDDDGMLDSDELEELRDAMRAERRENAEEIRDDIGSYRWCYDPDDIIY